MYCTLVLPYLDYCCEIWGNTYKSNLKKFSLLQKKAVRNVCESNYLSHTQPLFRMLNCLKFEDFVHLKTAVFMYKAFNDLLPSNIQKMFVRSIAIHDYATRQQHNLYVQQVNTTLRKNSISIVGTKIWNKLEVVIKTKPSVMSFKNALKLFLLGQY